MRRHNVFLASAGLVAGILLSLASVTVLTRPASAQMDAYLAAQKGQIMAVIFMLDRAGFHGLDESLAGGTLPAGSLGTVRRARIAVSATDWPDPLQEKAKALGSELRELEPCPRSPRAGARPVGRRVRLARR